MTHEEIQQTALQVIEAERDAVASLAPRVGDSFAQAVQAMLDCPGRIVVTGIGKSANIAQKIVSTLNSTGTPALFLHAADAIHGDLGMVRHDDVAVCISKSGNTPEIKVLVPLLKGFGNRLIAIVGNTDSFLARQADLVLDTTVEREACPNNLAPTSSTTAQLVMGDALAVALMQCRQFSSTDFARFHPGGALGKQLYLRVQDLYPQNERPAVAPHTPVREAILEMTSKRLGCAAVVDGDTVVGIITDGDLRRMLRDNPSLDHLQARHIMSANPKTIAPTEHAASALHLMRQCAITQLIVTDPERRYLGIIHIHDILREGII